MRFIILSILSLAVVTVSAQKKVTCEKLVIRTTTVPAVEAPNFKLNQVQVVKIDVPCLKEYQVIVESKNADVLVLKDLNHFQITPKAKKFDLAIKLNLGKDSVSVNNETVYTGLLDLSVESFLCRP